MKAMSSWQRNKNAALHESVIAKDAALPPCYDVPVLKASSI